LTVLSTNLIKDIEAIAQIEAVDSILEIICKTTGMGFAAVARVTKNNWIACAVRDEIDFGLSPGGELVLETTICHEIRQSHQAVIIDHVAEDPDYVRHHTPLMYGFQSYISVPIILKDGTFFGTLCAIDPKPANLKNSQAPATFRLFADLISFHLHALDQIALARLKMIQTESRLLEERKTSELREQFIAVLGHDLRNPLGAIANSAQLLRRAPLDERSMRLAGIIKDSSFRMKGLIDNILDFARGRLGEGISLNHSEHDQIEHILHQVIQELQMIWPQSTIETEFRVTTPVNCDGMRISQLFSNLLGNALTHGATDMPVKVEAATTAGKFELKITNFGEPIPAAAKDKLFQPFSRGEVRAGQEGLGLGLYIASQIAIAHNGDINVTSDHEGTCFTFSMPL
jgi:signal transduction histidine kinase